MSKKFLRKTKLAALWPAILAVSAAVLTAAEHHGTVQFGGAPVPGVTVTAMRGTERVAAVTDEFGAYSFADLADGAWTVRVEFLCFAPQTRELTIPADTTAAWDLKLLPLEEIRAAAGKVVDQGFGPPSAPGVTAGVVTGSNADPNSAKQNPPETKPADAKQAYQRAGLKASADGAKLAPEAAQPAGDANQTASDAFAINGTVNNGAASPFGQSGAFGNNRMAGRALYNFGLGVILANAALDARSYSLTGQDTPKPAYNHLQGIASVGGPLLIPHLFTTRNAPNFFLGYQLSRARNASIQSALLPTIQERNGDFSASQKQPVDPSTGAPFPGSVIPASRISPQAKALLSYYPLPNFDATARYNYQIPLVGSTDQDSIQARVNKSIHNRTQVYGVFNWQRTDGVSPNLFAFRDTSATTGLNAALNVSRRFGQRVFAHVQFQYSRLSARTTPFFANKTNVSGNAGITGNFQDPAYWGPPQLAFGGGFAALTDVNPSFNRNQTSALAYDTLWSRRSHNITLGADYKRLQFNSLSQQEPRGTFTFTGAAAGNDFAGFLLGIPDTSSIAYGNADKYFRSSSYDAYATDDWRIAPGLSANLGARWEYSAPITELYGRLVNLDIKPGFGAIAPVVAANPKGALTGQGFPTSLVRPDKKGLQPRLGVSWRPLGASSLVIRAGYGIYRDTSVYQSIATQMAQQSPLSKSFSVQNSANDPLTLANGFVASSTITRNTFAVDPNFRPGYAHSWQLSAQRDLPGSLVATVTYLGIKGTRSQQQFLPNTYPLGATNPCPSCPAGYAYLTSNGNSTRESGQVQLRRRLHNGFTASVSYTYSKSIDDAALGGRGQGTTVIAQNWLNLSGERGLSPFDQRHLLNVTMQYSSGVGLRTTPLMSGWRAGIFKDWTMTSQITAGTGLPQTPVYLAVVQGTGVSGSIRPDYTGAPLYNAPPGLSLNPAAYTAPAPGQWGDAGRNSITGPGVFTLNASMGRTFRVNDHVNTDFRLDATNALNHVTFTGWVTTVTNAQFGLPASANAMRTLSASLRVRF